MMIGSDSRSNAWPSGYASIGLSSGLAAIGGLALLSATPTGADAVRGRYAAL